MDENSRIRLGELLLHTDIICNQGKLPLRYQVIHQRQYINCFLFIPCKQHVMSWRHHYRLQGLYLIYFHVSHTSWLCLCKLIVCNVHRSISDDFSIAMIITFGFITTSHNRKPCIWVHIYHVLLLRVPKTYPVECCSSYHINFVLIWGCFLFFFFFSLNFSFFFSLSS